MKNKRIAAKLHDIQDKANVLTAEMSYQYARHRASWKQRERGKLVEEHIAWLQVMTRELMKMESFYRANNYKQ